MLRYAQCPAGSMVATMKTKQTLLLAAAVLFAFVARGAAQNGGGGSYDQKGRQNGQQLDRTILHNDPVDNPVTKDPSAASQSPSSPNSPPKP